MPNGDVIDSLSLEIGASVNKSISAIDELQKELGKLNGSLENFKDNGSYKRALENLSKGFADLSQSIEWLDETKINNTAKALNNLAKAADKIDTSFSGKGTKTDNNAFSGQAKSISMATEKLKEYGRTFAKESWISDENDIEQVADGFVDYAKKVALFGEKSEEAHASLEKLAQTTKMFASSNWLDDDLIGNLPGYDARDYLKGVNAGGGQVLVNNDADKTFDYARKRSILGKAFSSNAKAGSQDIENFLTEADSHLGTNFGQGDISQGFERMADYVEDLPGKVRDLSRAFIEWSADAQSTKGIIDEVIPSMQALIEMAEQTFSSTSSSGGMVANTDNGFVALAQSIKELSGLKIPDMTNLNTLISAANRFGSEKSAVASENIPKLIEGLKPLEAGFQIPDFTNLGVLAGVTSKFGSDSAVTASTNIPAIAGGLKQLDGVAIPDFSNLSGLASAITRLGNDKAQNASWVLPNIMAELESFSQHFSGLTIDANALSTIQQLGSAFSKLGGKNANEAIKTLPQLSDAIRQMVDDLNSLPEVSDKTQQLVVALGNLAKANGKVQTSNAGTNKSFNMLSATIQKFSGWVMKSWKNTNVLQSAINGLKSGINNFNNGMKSAKTHTESLTMAIVKVRTLIWGLKRVMSFFSGAIENASSLTEVQNVVANVYDPSYIEEFEKAAENTITTLGMSKLSFEQYASRYQAMGKAMGITNSQMSSAEDHLKSMGIEYGLATGKMGDMSVNLTRLAADMASFYDISQEDVYEKLQAIYTGQTRPLRALGIDLTQATLQEWAMKQGLDANVSSMTQAQKTMLRYQYVLAQSTAAMGDFQRTQETFHNQTVILKESIKALGTIIGQGLINAIKPALKAFNIFLQSTIAFAQNVLNALGKIFGWEYEITGGGIADDALAGVEDIADDLGDATGGADDLGDSVGGVGDALDDANDNAKKLKATILGFDELNVLNDVADTLNSGSGGSGGGSGSGGKGSGSGSGAGSGSGVGAGSANVNPIKLMKKKMESEIDNLYDLGKYISDALKKTLDDIDWDKVYEKARNFGKGLAQFLNGLIQPDTFYSVGRTLANSLNAVVEAALAFVNEFDWKKAGKSLEQGLCGIFENINWQNIYALADGLGKGLADYLNNLFTPTLFAEAGQTLARSLNTVFHFLDNFGKEFEWKQFGESLSAGLVAFINEIDWETALSAAKEWGTGIATALNSFIESGDQNKWRMVGQTIGNAIKTGLVAVISLTGEIHWDEVGHAVSDTINGALDQISGKDVADAINGIVEGLNEAIGICKEDGTFDRIGDEIFEVIKNLHWGEIAKLLKDSAMLDLAVGMATGLAEQLASNPVKSILEGGVGILGNTLSTLIALKLLGVGGAGAAGAGATASASAAAAGTAISGSLAAGLIAGGVAVAAAALVIAGIVSAATYEWKDKSVEGMATLGEEIAVRLGLISENWLRENKRVTDGEELMYRDLLEKAKQNGYDRATYWDEANRKFYQITEDSTGKIEKKELEFWDATKNAFSDGKDGANESVNGLWENTESVFSEGEQSAIDHINNLWNESKSKTDEGTKDTLATIKDFADNHEAELSGLKEKIIGTTEEAWSNAGRTTSDYTAQMQNDVSTSTENMLNSAETNLSPLPGTFDGYLGQCKEQADAHLSEMNSNVESSLGETSTVIEGTLCVMPSLFSDYFGQSKDEAIWQLEDLQNSASSILDTVSSWLSNAISMAQEAASYAASSAGNFFGGFFASGGFPDAGEIFVARENASPEMVGRIGTRTAVANNDQIVAGIRAGVMDGMMQVYATTSGGNSSSGQMVNEFTFKVGEETIYQAVLRGKEKYDRRYQTVATMA